MTYSVTPVSEILRDEIARSGPLLFSQFMETALYHPEHGYYRRQRDPFGREGDFFTAEQVQPVFGRIIAQYLQRLGAEHVVELGAGRCDMAPFFTAIEYTPVDSGFGAMPDNFTGAVFANEFFDALPVDVVVSRDGGLHQVRVGWNGAFTWVEAEPASAAAHSYIEDAAGRLPDGTRLEVCLPALEWVRRIAASLTSGHALIIDYGYTRRESVRFPEGSLMSYHRHRASPDVLEDPGERDITAHVAFSALEAEAVRAGSEVLRYESMASLLLRAGEPDQFSAALHAGTEREALRLRMQLKTLLFGMGETFRVLLLKK